ncbi:hypothetical protein CCR75_005942 [Bremia lactucae]|uniref:protein-tyrosine-phosphatase n=1 Tax=Bremia lactucae TaxID=4779 RepID=A0A976FIZ7_BRELC|nr:hypothetical protein CCR75_005942 [Bremia lactucae]
MVYDERHSDTKDAQQKTFDAAASGASTCPVDSNRSAEPFVEAEIKSTTLSFRNVFALRRLRRKRVPVISVTSLYNRLQTSGVVLVDCRKVVEFAAGHLPNALHCPQLNSKAHLSVISCVGQVAQTVSDVLEITDNAKLRDKLKFRDLMEVVIIGGNHNGSSLLYRLDWGYRFAKMLADEGRVFSVRFLAQGFPAFAEKYKFMLVASPLWMPIEKANKLTSSAHTLNPSPGTHFPNEIIDEFLYLGNFWQANSAEVVDALQISHIINMGAITDQRNKFKNVQYLDVAIKDKVDVDIAQEFGRTVKFIQKVAAENGRVLIHCVQGVSRSSTICIWYVMLKTKCTLSAAYSHVLKCRPLIFPNRGFMVQLIANERELYGDQSVMEDELELLQNGLLSPVDRSGSALCRTFLP